MAGYFKGSTTRDAVGYKCGEDIEFRLELSDGARRFGCPLFKWEMYGDDGAKSSGMAPGESGTIDLHTTLAKPGFVHVIVTACALDGTPLPTIDKFEGGAGAEIDKIEQGTPDPDDFDEFWKGQLARLDEVEPRVLYMNEIDSGDPDYRSYDIRLECVGPMPVSGILTLPRDAKPKSLRGRLGFHGYSFAVSNVVRQPNTAYFQVNIHGINNFDKQSYYDEFSKAHAGFGFDRNENKSPETCYFLYVILRDIQAARYLKSIPEYDGGGVLLDGGSMGALQAVSVAAHIDFAAGLNIYIPWLCDLGGIKVGRLRGWRPEPDAGVMYFDTAIQAKRVTCPVEITCGLGDYVCPPSTEVVLWHNFKTQKKITFIQNMTHPYRPPEIISYTR